MVKLISALLFLCTNFLYCQNFRIYYTFNFKKHPVTQYEVLDHTTAGSAFFEDKLIHPENRFKSSIHMQDIYRTRNSDSITNYLYDNLSDIKLKVITSEKINWKILPETKTAGDYSLQKSEGELGGRKWTAWFSADMPIIDGPYKFFGLPGLVFEVADSENIFHYELIKIEKLPADFKIEPKFHEKTKDAIPATMKDYYKLWIDFYNDPMKADKNYLTNGGETDDPIAALKNIRTREKEMRRIIQELYVPIQKDLAIPFPFPKNKPQLNK